VSAVDPGAGAELVRELGRACGFDWDHEEARAVSDQLQATRDGLRLAATRLDTSCLEPATSFEVGR